jgi:hypothetical protein
MATIYLGGHDVSLDAVRLVARRCGPIEVAVLFVGAAHAPLSERCPTLTSDQAAQAAEILNSPSVIPAYADGREHTRETIDDLRAAFVRNGCGERLRVLGPGDTATV